MEKAEYENMYVAEESHFYYVSLHKLILSLLKRYAPKKSLNILDAGCGTGRLAELMQQYGNVIGIDMSDEALKFAKKRGLTVQKASVMKLPFKDNSFEVITSIDVIYHKAVNDDVKALKEMHRVLKPNGVLILRVQAIPWLKTSHDRFVHGARRYSKKMLQTKLVASGFTTVKLSYMNAILAPVGIAQHVYETFLPPKAEYSSVKQVNQLINMTALGILKFEGKLLYKINLPYGLGLLAVCKKTV